MAAADRALLLTPGASATRDHSSLVAIERAVAPVPVGRIDLPRRKADALVATVTGAATALARDSGLVPERVALGGRSLGGRVCSLAVARGVPALGLALVSYPLHPPGRPEQARTEHFSSLGVPCLFVSGTRDPFGSPSELEAATTAVAGPVTHVWIEGGDHGLRGHDAPVSDAVRDWLLSLP